MLEFGVAVWHSGITSKMRDTIERMQKICINIILCDSQWNVPYEGGSTLLNIEPLVYRRFWWVGGGWVVVVGFWKC